MSQSVPLTHLVTWNWTVLQHVQVDHDLLEMAILSQNYSWIPISPGYAQMRNVRESLDGGSGQVLSLRVTRLWNKWYPARQFTDARSHFDSILGQNVTCHCLAGHHFWVKSRIPFWVKLHHHDVNSGQKWIRDLTQKWCPARQWHVTCRRHFWPKWRLASVNCLAGHHLFQSLVTWRLSRCLGPPSRLFWTLRIPAYRGEIGIHE